MYNILLKISMVLLCLLVAYKIFILLVTNGVTYFSRFQDIYTKKIGLYLVKYNEVLEKKIRLNKKSKQYKIYKYFDEILTNLDLKDSKVTVVGLLFTLVLTASILSIIVALIIKEVGIIIPMVLVLMYLFCILLRLASLAQYEKREAVIMDAEDLLVSDIRGGVQNAITKYQDSFDSSIRVHFKTFLDNLKYKNYSFEKAMFLLNDALGDNFNTFAQNAIYFNEKADDTTVEIFGSILDINRQRRVLREINNKKFRELRLQFIISVSLIGLYALYTVWAEPFIMYFFINYFIGKLLLLGDILLIAWVLSYMTKLKAQKL